MGDPSRLSKPGSRNRRSPRMRGTGVAGGTLPKESEALNADALRLPSDPEEASGRKDNDGDEGCGLYRS